jgi:2-polyprenyl-3-methyl-5-hydroxy-6-metoxy-1,4-benzoquinol methylase
MTAINHATFATELGACVTEAGMSSTNHYMTKNGRTISSYESYADQYDKNVAIYPGPHDAQGLKRLAEYVGAGGQILEVGSGPGRDADFLETLGVTVKRTDATRRFIEIQAARGKTAEYLDIITGDLGGPYDAVAALCVIIHVPREQTDMVLAKITRALRPGGAFLVSMRDGDGETDGNYHMIFWRRDQFAERLEAAGMRLIWDAFSIDTDGEAWNTFLAVRAP